MQLSISDPYVKGTLITVVLVLLYFCGLHNYLLFHSIAEIFSIVIAFSIFVIGLNAGKYISGNFLIFISVAYLFVGFLDLLHTLSYVGMPIFTDYDYYANQLWIAARYMESLSILTAFLFLNGTKKFNILYAILVFSAITGLIIGSVFIWKNFPVCFVEGEGLTVFKKGSEYVINLILAICIWLLNRNRHYFSKNVYKWLLYSLICTIIAEFAFTFYISNYGFSNLIGHYFKIFSFYFIYKALVSTGIEEPYSVIFRELSQKEKALKESNAAKDKLFSVIMHDIRGPLGGLMLFTREVNKNFDSYGPEIIQDLLQKAEQSIASLYEMMETLFIWAKSNSVKIQPKYTSAPLLKLVNLSVEPLLKMIEDKGIVMDVCISDELILICDEEITKTVVRNIVSNAVKFSPNGGLIEIKGIEDSGNVYMTVRNEGEGIPHQKLMRIFELDSDKSTVGTAGEKGTGIGLVLCRDLMSLQGGVIRIFSTEGIGVEVKLIFARNYI